MKTIIKRAGVLLLSFALLTLMGCPQWQKYKVTYTTEHGSAPAALDELEYETALTAADLPALTSRGYEFLGWYNGDTKVTAGYSVTSSITLTAKWKHRAEVVDYRNKDADGNVVARSAARTTAEDFSYKLLDVLEPFDRGKAESNVQIKGTNEYITASSENKAAFEKMKNAISFEDHPDGIKLVFKKPADYDNVTGIVFQYIDNAGNRSTCIDSYTWAETFQKGDFEVVYPLVIEGQKANFWLQLGDDNDSHPEVNFFYEIMPVHGLGAVEDMQENYEETDYINITDGHIMNITLMIPPDAENLLHYITLHEQEGGEGAWSYKDENGNEVYYKNVNGLGYISEPASEDEVEAAKTGKKIEYSLDLSKKVVDSGEEGIVKAKYTDQPYIFAGFIYRYTLPKFPGYFFASPEIKSKPVENKYFKTTSN